MSASPMPMWFLREFWLRWAIMSPEGDVICDAIAQADVEGRLL